jgi:hypothetical protein
MVFLACVMAAGKKQQSKFRHSRKIVYIAPDCKGVYTYFSGREHAVFISQFICTAVSTGIKTTCISQLVANCLKKYFEKTT